MDTHNQNDVRRGAMAKKGQTEGVLAREARQKAEADAAKAAAEAAERAAEVARQAAEAKRAAREEAERLRAEKAAVKKPRYVREKAAERPEAAAAPLPARSTTLGGKMMSTGLKAAPKDKPGNKPKGPQRPRPR